MIEIAPVAHGEQVKAIAFAIELYTFLNGEFREDALEWDIDPLADWYVENVVPDEDREAYNEERQLAEDEVRQSILVELSHHFQAHGHIFGDSYPFEADRANGLLLQRKVQFDCSPQFVCYLWLALFRASHEPTECVIIGDDDKSYIHAQFANVFEIVAAYATIGRMPGTTWYLGSSRSATKLVRRLGHATRVIGTGVPKPLNQLDLNQVNDNDGGVDILHFAEDDVQSLILVGATIQKANRKSKIIGGREKNRFRNFFIQEIALPHQGVMAVPFDHSEVDQLNCAQEDCQYFCIDVITKALGHAEHFVERKTRHLNIRLRQHTRDLVDHFALHQFDVVTNCQSL